VPKEEFKNLKGCDDSKVMPLDKVKDEFVSLIKMGEAKKLTSVDAVKLNKNNDLCFIEIKLIDFDNECKKSGRKPVEILEERVRESFAKFSDSILIMTSILSYFGLPDKFHSTLLSPSTIKIIPYILINCKSSELEPFQVALRHLLTIKFSARLHKEIKLINCYTYNEIFNA
jgi:hypothetical protein